jgi:hypothetical protein
MDQRQKARPDTFLCSIPLLTLRVMEQLGMDYPHDLVKDVPTDVRAVIAKQLLTLCKSSAEYRVNVPPHHRGGAQQRRVKHTVKPRNGVTFQYAKRGCGLLGARRKVESSSRVVNLGLQRGF